MADRVWPKGFQFFTDTGAVLNGGTISVYDAGTTNDRTVYKDADEGTPWTQPITLNSAGRLTDPVYVPTGEWKYILKTSGGSTVITEDDIPGAIDIPSAAFAQPEIPVLTKASNYTITTSDLGSLVKADPTGGNITLTLPSAITAGDGATIFAQHTGSAGKVTIAPFGSQTIDGGSSVIIVRPFAWFALVSDGANWSAMGADRLFATLSKSADYTATLVDVGKTIKVDASGGAKTITLPPAASVGDGFELGVIKVDSSTNAVTLDGDGSETINGTLTLALGAQWDGVRLRCDGSNWQIIRAPRFTATPTSLAVDTDNWAPTGLAYSDVIRAAASPAVSVSGLSALGGGAVRTIENIGSNNITLLGNNTASTAANRFLLPRPVVLRPSQSITLVYDATSPGWRSSGLLTGMPIAAGFKNLKVQVTGNSTVAVTADAITLEDTNGEAVRALSVSLSIDPSVSGANGLDTGAEASSTWYSVWAIYNPTTNTQAGLLSTSATAPTMPSGYTFKARVSWVRNDGSSNLLRTLQYGRRAQYVIGTNPTLVPSIADASGGSVGTYSNTNPVLATASVTSVVPTATASAIWVIATTSWKNGAQAAVLVAPNTSYGGTANGGIGSNGQYWPIFMPAYAATGSASFFFNETAWIMLEATTIAWCANAAGGAIGCLGWEDNI